MARVRMIEPDEANPETQRVYDGVLKQWGRISNFSKVLAHQPAALEGWMLPNEMIRLANVKADPDYVKIQQLVIIKTSALNQSAYCMSHNVPLGRKIGLTREQIAAAQGDDYMRSPDLLSEEEVRTYLLHLRDERGVARGTFKTNHGGIRFLYARTLDRDWPLFSQKNACAHRASSACQPCSPTTRLVPSWGTCAIRSIGRLFD